MGSDIQEIVYPIQSSSGDFLSDTGFPFAEAIAYRLISPPGEMGRGTHQRRGGRNGTILMKRFIYISMRGADERTVKFFLCLESPLKKHEEENYELIITKRQNL